jgi:hypothetical protein
MTNEISFISIAVENSYIEGYRIEYSKNNGTISFTKTRVHPNTENSSNVSGGGYPVIESDERTVEVFLD